MSTSALRKSFLSSPVLAAALALPSVMPAMAQEARSAPVGVYVGTTFGIGVSNWECGTTCDRAAFSGKVFGGKRLTPGLAAEINYMYFGGLNAANDRANAAQRGGVSDVRSKTRVLTLGINWEVELLNEFVNSLRFGWALTRRSDQLTYSNGLTRKETVQDGAPYFGAGLGFQISRDVRMLSGFDYVINGKDSMFLFSVGASADF